MTIIHSPRVIASIVRGLREQSSSNNVGIVTHHKYNARVGLFDVDYLGHLNNAAFLNHAEYARWQMTASNKILPVMYKTKTNFMVSSASCRYRAQVRPLFRKFQVQSIIAGLDDKNFWIYQTFRLPESGNNRVRAQVLVKGVAVRNREVVNPKDFMVEEVGTDPEVVESLSRPNADASVEDMISHFEQLDTSYRESAAADDDQLLEN